MNLVFLHTVADVLRRHPKRVMGSLGALLLGTGVTAFGVAPLAPDAADLPVRSVSEAIEPALRLVQGNGEATVPFVLFRSDMTRRDDSAQSLLQRLGVTDSAAVAFLRSDPRARELLTGRPGKLVTVETTDRNEIIRLSARWLAKPDDRQFQRLVLERQGVRWVNDSKGTNIGATLAALAGLRSSVTGKLILIAGGDAKGADVSELTAVLQQDVQQLITLGQDGPAIAALKSDSIQVKTLLEAVKVAAKLAKHGDMVLLSPACASLDMFKSYADRGEQFAAAVKAEVL